MPEIDIMLADLKVRIKYNYEYMSQLCKDYTARFDTPDISATANNAAILREKELAPTASNASCESLCIYRSIGEKLPFFDRFVFHGAAIEYGGNAYVFTAPSGTGKTTHINLWKRYLGDEVSVINGDKPIIKAKETPTVFGTPWAGKEGYQQNISAPIKSICVLKQGKNNNIFRLDKTAAINHLMRQVYLPHDANALSKTLQLIGYIIEATPVYMLECDISKGAFDASFNLLTK